jgi:hypothetical protein
MDAGVVHGAGVVVGVAWGTTEVVGTARVTVKVGKEGNLGPPASISEVI